jgi:ATP-binding cassette subfamily D (ALD) long-chain fatty acid import protein
VEKEVAELRERLGKVEGWKKRREEIEKELSQVWVEGGDELAPPSYVESEKAAIESNQETAESEAGGLEESQTSVISGASGEEIDMR